MQSLLELGLEAFMEQCRDWELLLLLIKKDSSNYKYVSKCIRDNPEFAMRAMKQRSSILVYIESLYYNRNIVLEALKLDGLDLSFIPEKLQDDIDIVKEAVKQNIRATDYITEKIKHSKRFMLQLLEVNGGVLDYVWTKFYAQTDDAKDVKLNPLLMQYLLCIALKGNVASVGKLPEKWLTHADSIE